MASTTQVRQANNLNTWTSFGRVNLSVLPTNAVSVRWPWPSTGWVLQQNSDLSTTNWIPSPFPISDESTYRVITITPPPSRLFFRLTR